MDTSDPVWRIEMLGSLRAHRDTQTLERFQTRKTEALLAFLARYPQQVHPRESLIALLWPDAEPEAGRNRLSQAVTWLRAHLEPEAIPRGTILIANRQSVGLAAAAVSSDVNDFETFLEAVKRASDRDAQVAILERAVALYQGDFLAGHYDDWVIAESQRLREEFLNTLRSLAELLEETGKADAAVATARRLVAVEPLAEEGHGLLIRLLLKQGQGDAARRQLRELERSCEKEGEQVSAGIRALFDTTPVVSPVAAGKPPLRNIPVLPTSLTKFFGREAEGREIGRLLQAEGVRLVTLLGTGGAGKTRLAVEVARHLSECFGNAIWFAPLADVSDAHAIPALLVEVLRVPRSSTPPLESVIVALSARPSLLILDNLEHLAEGVAPVLRNLLEHVPTLTILATSRQRLGLEGEHEVVVPPLPAPANVVGGDKTSNTLEALQHLESVRLFVDRAQLVRSDFTLRDENIAAVAQLCERLEGIPLAIELCAAWAQTLTPTQMLAQLTRRFDLLVSRRKDIAARHRTLRAALEYSFLLLPLPLQQLFTRLSVFRGGWSLNAAAFVCLPRDCHEPALKPLDVLEQLTELRERSLLIAEENPQQEMRYRMLETLREFAAEQQTLAVEEPLRRRHATYFCQLAQEAASHLTRPDQTNWLEQLENEHDNLRAALAWCLETRAVEVGLELGVALAVFWDTRGFLAEGQEWLERLLALPATEADKQGPRAKALNALARLARARGQFAVAEAAVGQALDLGRSQGERATVAASLQILATLAYSREDYGTAQATLEQALALAREADDPPLVAGALTNLGNIAMELCDWPRARSLYGEALEMHRGEGDQKRIADVLNNLGLVARYQGDYLTAQHYLEEDLTIGRALANPSGMGIALLNLGTVHRLQGHFTQARQLLEEAATLSFEVDNKRALAWCVKELGHLACAEKRHAFGIRLISASENLRRVLGISFKPADPEALEQDKERGLSALGQEAFDTAWALGSRLSFTNAYQDALKVARLSLPDND